MAKKKTKKLKLLKGEKLMYVILLFLIVSIPIANIFTQALLSETNINVEKIESKIKKQKASNETLAMRFRFLLWKNTSNWLAELDDYSFTTRSRRAVPYRPDREYSPGVRRARAVLWFLQHLY